MGKADQKAVKSQTQQQMDKTNTQSTANNEMLTGILGTAQSNAGELLPQITSSYKSLYDTGGFDPAITGQINKTFGGMAESGGISPEDASAMRTRAALAARSAYSTAGDTASRSLAATGNYGSGTAILGDLARKGSNAAADAEMSSAGDIAGLQQRGKLAGAAGLADTQRSIAAGKLAAAGGMTNVYGLNTNQVNQTVDAIIQNFQATGTLNNQDLSILTNLANQPGVFDKIVSTIGTLGGAAAGVMGALPLGGVKNPKQN